MKRIVLISGVSGGIGLATAELFLEKGWQVIGVDRKKSRALPKDLLFLEGDVSNDEHVRDMYLDIDAQFGQLHALVNNASIQLCKPLSKMEVDEWDHLMRNNVRSAFSCMKYGLPLLAKCEGSIVNVSSVHARQTSCDISAYAASKGALSALTRAAALDFARYGVRVNAVLPGATDTGMLRAGLSRGHVDSTKSLEERLEQLAKKHPHGEVGRPLDIAQAIVFLADNDTGKFIVGEELVVDGGAMIRLSTE